MIDEDAVMSSTTGFICRKCVRALEGFQTARAKLLQSAEAALQCMSSRPKTGGSSELYTAEKHSSSHSFYWFFTSCSGIWQAAVKQEISDWCWGGEGTCHTHG